jgi:hypothetical protein
MVALVLGGLAAAPLEAVAEEAQVELARSYYEKGDAAYGLGKFDEAAGWFSKSYDAWPATDLLFNIAQAHRRAGDCKQALLVYRRYLSLKDQAQEASLTARERADVARFIREATVCVASASVPAPSASAPASTAPVGQRTPAGTGDVAASAGVHAARQVSIYATGGTAWFVTGGALDIPAQPSFAAGGRYSLPAGPVSVEIGARGTFSPIRYEAMRTRQWASLASAHATVGATYVPSRRLSVQAEVGAGLSRLGGLVAYNPFTKLQHAGTVTMPSLRVGLAAEYAITPRLRATLPSIGLSWFLAPDELTTRSFGQLEVQLGVGYQM